MEINVETAQLILDAIAWTNEMWNDDFVPYSEQDMLNLSRQYFVQFCKDRGIESVVVEGGTIIHEDR